MKKEKYKEKAIVFKVYEDYKKIPYTKGWKYALVRHKGKIVLVEAYTDKELGKTGVSYAFADTDFIDRKQFNKISKADPDFYDGKSFEENFKEVMKMVLSDIIEIKEMEM